MNDYLILQTAKAHLNELEQEATIFRSLRGLTRRVRHPSAKEAEKCAAPQPLAQPACCPAGA